MSTSPRDSRSVPPTDSFVRIGKLKQPRPEIRGVAGRKGTLPTQLVVAALAGTMPPTDVGPSSPPHNV
jgi:hypothetical protein